MAILFMGWSIFCAKRANQAVVRRKERIHKNGGWEKRPKRDFWALKENSKASNNGFSATFLVKLISSTLDSIRNKTSNRKKKKLWHFSSDYTFWHYFSTKLYSWEEIIKNQVKFKDSIRNHGSTNQTSPQKNYRFKNRPRTIQIVQTRSILLVGQVFFFFQEQRNAK